MRLSSLPLARIKNVLHLLQALGIVLAIILTIAVFTTQGSTDGRTGWYFGLCFLSLPIIAYLTVVPTWPRARKFGNIYAFLVLDCFGVTAWLSAWAAVTSYVVAGKGNGEVENESGCKNFKYGSVNKCRLSEASIVLGVIIMLFFLATALISFKAVMEYKRTGVLPGSTSDGAGVGAAGPLGGIKPTGGAGHGAHDDDEEEAFDSNMNLRHDWEVDEYDHDEYHDRYGTGSGAGGHTSHGYAPADGEEHGIGYTDSSPQQHQYSGSADFSGDNSGGYASHASHSNLGAYSDDHDLSSHRPASTGPGPLGADTSYNSSSYGHGGSYGR